ncbi:DUF1080 domain-containing protein [Aeoliella sp. ICT_H6.2]|uniref:DUF1080 domain-containing protein n=1 Tax=Aeoliella straminimaris TaxID=2954799 RepID=A0A9X2FEQ9_9BACT|nr:DUF1080 domain-containing protein [Aeoliella straminimaris]MCO6044451.1 DUF1080 domain-containing protein [Aeoliella straminimaris]
MSRIIQRFACWNFTCLLAAIALAVSTHLPARGETPATTDSNKTAPDEAGPVSNQFRELFNGKDLSGWKGAPGWWQVRDGLLICESTAEKPCTRSHYLYWTGGEPGDFELKAVFRITGDGNSGIQFRSEPRPDWDTWGYQADLDTAGQYTGCVYQHERGLVAERGQRVRIDESGEKHIESIGDSAELLKKVRPGEWNEYRIVAKGPTIQLWINDTPMCEVEDHQRDFVRSRGILALQMHQGPPMKIEFKSVRLRSLDDQSSDSGRE